MTDYIEYIVVGIITLGALAWIARRLWRTVKAKRPGCCQSCPTCKPPNDDKTT